MSDVSEAGVLNVFLPVGPALFAEGAIVGQMVWSIVQDVAIAGAASVHNFQVNLAIVRADSLRFGVAVSTSGPFCQDRLRILFRVDDRVGVVEDGFRFDDELTRL